MDKTQPASSIAIEIRFTAGRYHANPWGRHVNEGAVEWPPSPWRFLRALIAVWSSQGAPDESHFRGLLSKLTKPPRFYLPPTTASHFRHYVPHDKGRRLLLDAFVSCQEGVTLVWDGPALTMGEEKTLANLLCELTYLGRAESWCQAVQVQAPGQEAQAFPVTGNQTYTDPTVPLLCAEPTVTLEQLEITTAEVRRRRLNRPPGSKWVSYAIARGLAEHHPLGPCEPEQSARPQLAVYLVESAKPIPKAHTLRLADRVRRELLRLHGEHHSPIFGGKLFGIPRADNHRHLHVLPEGEEHIARVVLWAKQGFGPGEMEALRTLRSLPEQGRQQPLKLFPWQLLASPGPKFFGQSQIWQSSTPYLAARHAKANGRESLACQVQRECSLRGLPQPEVTVLDPPSERYHTCRPGQKKPPGSPQNLRLDFPETIAGPLCLGANSHFGMGRFLPH